MKLSLHWCQQFLTANVSADSLEALLTNRGLEVEEIESFAVCSGIVVGEILTLERVGKKNHLCSVNVGANHPLSIVCGAANVVVGGLVAVAPIGAMLQNSVIDERTVDNIVSQGMICSAAELGIAKDSNGILLFGESDRVCVGESLEQLLGLNDTVYDIGITPNRGDCLSHLGIAREVAAAIGCTTTIAQHDYKPDYQDCFDVVIADDAMSACPFYNALLIRDIDCSIPSPWWLRSLLERCGSRSINIAADITNYLMLAYGQPLHAFDADKLNERIVVRFAHDDEKITVLDGKLICCKNDTLLITDNAKAVALGGVMGGLESSVTESTKNVLLECAFFEPQTVRGRSRDFKLTSDAAFRYERGVNPQLPITILEKGAGFIQQLTNAKTGPVSSCGCPPNNQYTIALPVASIGKILGIDVSAQQAMDFLNGLQIENHEHDGVLHCITPAWRFDLKIKEDIIEEIVRSWGYAQLPETMPMGGRALSHVNESIFSDEQSRTFFAHHGFHEVISYAFVPTEWEAQLSCITPLTLKNPISEDMSVMRTTLLGGLLQQALFNHRHRNENIKLFELGRCFFPNDADNSELPYQPNFLGGVAVSDAVPMRWNTPLNTLDFYDIKGLLEKYLNPLEDVSFRRIEKSTNKALHPNKSADIVCTGTVVGQVGELHPMLPFAREFSVPVLLFSLNTDCLNSLLKPKTLKPISIFPMVQRDLSLIIDPAETAGVGTIVSHILQISPTLPIVSVDLFDVYEKDEGSGENIIGIRLKLQKFNDNFKGEEINSIVLDIMNDIKKHFKLRLRGE